MLEYPSHRNKLPVLGLYALVSLLGQFPEVPEAPEAPKTPEIPETPSVPEAPTLPETPGVGQEPGASGAAAPQGPPTFPPELSCPSRTAMCVAGKADCFDLKKDPRHCGACGRACDPFSQCMEGRCIQGIAVGLIGTTEVGIAGPATTPGAILRGTSFREQAGALGSDGNNPPGLPINLLLGASLGFRYAWFEASVRGFLQQASTDDFDFEEMGLDARFEFDVATILALGGTRFRLGPVIGYRSRRVGADFELENSGFDGSFRRTAFVDILDLGGRLSFRVPTGLGTFIEPFFQTTAGLTLAGRLKSEGELDGVNRSSELEANTKILGILNMQGGIAGGFSIPTARTKPKPKPLISPPAFITVRLDPKNVKPRIKVRETPAYKALRRRLDSLAVLAPPNCASEPSCPALMGQLEEFLTLLGFQVASWRSVGFANPLGQARELGAQALLQVDELNPNLSTTAELEDLQVRYLISNPEGAVFDEAVALSELDRTTILGLAEDKGATVPKFRMALALTNIRSGQAVWRFNIETEISGGSSAQRYRVRGIPEYGKPPGTAYRWSRIKTKPEPSEQENVDPSRDEVPDEVFLKAATLLRCSRRSDPNLPECIQ